MNRLFNKIGNMTLPLFSLSRCFLLLLFILTVGSSIAGAETARMPLEKFLGKKVFNMKCTESNFSIYVPIPDRWKVKRATLNFKYINSPTLLSEASMLGVRINNKTVWKKALDPKEPEHSTEVELPVDILGHKYNDINFFIGQHFTLKCESPCDPNLWTDLDFSNAYLTVEYDLLPVPLLLSKAHNFLFDSKTFKSGHVNILLPNGDASASDVILTTATVLASGIAKRFDYVPVTFSVSNEIKPGMDNILIGRTDEVRRFLPEGVPTDIKGPSVKIARLPLERMKYMDMINSLPLFNEMPEETNSSIKNKEVRKALADWLASWSNEDIKSYDNFYSSKFISSNGRSKKQYIKRKKMLFREIGVPVISISNISVSMRGNEAQAVFLQDYKSLTLSGKKWKKYKSKDWKALLLVKEDGRLKILSEQTSRKKPPTLFSKKVQEKIKKNISAKIESDGKAEEENSDPYHALIILSGTTDEDVKLATEAFVSLTFPYPGVPEMEVLGFKMEDIKTYTGKSMIETGKPTKFRKLNFNTKTFLGLLPAPKTLHFSLPPDFDIKSNQYAKLNLNFVYSGGLRADSDLNILVNGVFATTISFDNPDGATLEDYKISIPTYLFRPGKNKISFKPVMIPDTDECQPVLPASLFITIYDNSKLLFPKMPHFVKMPNINLFMLNGYPFTIWPDGLNTLILLSDKNNPALEVAMNIVGVMTQNNGFPLFSIDVRKTMPDKWDGNIMMFGTIGSLIDEVSGNASLGLKKVAKIPYPFSKNPRSESLAHIQQISGIGVDRGAILEFKSPYGINKTAIVFSAEKESDLAKLGVAITDGVVQRSAEKDFVIVDFSKPDYQINSLATEQPYYVGADSVIQRLTLYFYTNRNGFYIVVGILLLMIIMATIMMYRNILIRKASEEDPEVGRSVFGVFSILKKAFLFLFIKRK